VYNYMIAILLSAYNGADYIGKQIDSLLSQTYQDFTILGMMDLTTELLESLIRLLINFQIR